MSSSPTKRRLVVDRKSISTANLLNIDSQSPSRATFPSPLSVGMVKTFSSSSLAQPSSSRPSTRMSLGQQQLHNQINLSTLSLDDLHNVPVINPNTFYAPMTAASSTESLSTLGEASPSPCEPYINEDGQQSRIFMNSTATLSNINLSSNRVNLLNEPRPEISNLKSQAPVIELPYGDTTFNYDSSVPLTEFMRTTITTVPTKRNMWKKCNIPFALHVKPFSSLYDNKNPMPVCNDKLIITCKRCGSYLNPYVKFTPQSNQWRCNFCKLANNLPILYNTYDIELESDDVNNNTMYKDRPEVNYSVVDYIIDDKMSNIPPKVLNYTFIIDVSYNSIKSGMLRKTLETISQALDRIPDYDNGTTISVICVNDRLHYFELFSDDDIETKELQSSFRMYDVFDIDEPFLPVPSDQLRVPMYSHMNSIANLLSSIEAIFTNTSSLLFALGPALESAYLLLNGTGGKIFTVIATLPNNGVGKLKDRCYANSSRNDLNNDGTGSKYSTTMDCQDIFYKEFALKCLECGISIEQFLSSNGNYLDIATLSCLTNVTSGKTHYYPNIKLQNDRFDDVRYSIELYSTLTMDVSMDAAIEVRASHNIGVTSSYGNIFERSPGIYYCPIISRDQSYTFAIEPTEDFVSDKVFFQVSVLSTMANGERRVRVMTLPLPTTNNIQELYNKIDQRALTLYYAQFATFEMTTNSAAAVQKDLISMLVKILTSYSNEVLNIKKRKECKDTFQVSRSMQLLPTLILALVKSQAFCLWSANDNKRANFLNQIKCTTIDNFIQLIYPTILPIHQKMGMQSLVQPINNSVLNCSTNGIYLIDNAIELILWIGADVDPDLLFNLLGVRNPLEVVEGLTELPEIVDSSVNCKVRDIIEKIRERTQDTIVKYQSLYIFVGTIDDSNQITRLSKDPESFQYIANIITHCMIEDPIYKTDSYSDFLEKLHSIIVK
ncbi:COPII subunit [Maudiozyma exigua]|uniref:COPII subunit n=1 Tax=Maudiozyma exigua TaxID=34358 RepID=A0A9P6W137_MAUEX|nr:COPII subunit [Kazachstania exigua]